MERKILLFSIATLFAATFLINSSSARKVKNLPFNRYSWLTTHNAFARLGKSVAPTNQQDSITDQLNGTHEDMRDRD
ncbi:hypothetical protein TIFTF001_006993 [Ficus carica]|uniref:Uncharacterized protein n=1 Tax=Ficus carica TaxID=3494 RepID=A0AA88A1V7_FICCA|nr:hypothetical protein TIFTF001_006993 [Ficus carica]